jgi:hypothetical protein
VTITFGMSRCDECGNRFEVRDTLNALAGACGDQEAIQQVIKPLAERYGYGLWIAEYVCPSCAFAPVQGKGRTEDIDDSCEVRLAA